MSITKYAGCALAHTVAAAALFAALAIPHIDVCAQAASNEDALWQAAKERADKRIDSFEQTLRSGDAAKIRQAALVVQGDPIAVQTMNKKRPDALKQELNGVLDGIRQQTRETVRREVAKQQGVKPEQVVFFEATNPSDDIKVGQDWDVTVRIDSDNTLDTASRANGERPARSLKDLRIDDTQAIVHNAYYEAATGQPAPSPGEAREFAHKQAVEVVNYQGAEAYGGGIDEGEHIITGPKDQQLRDPAQIAKAMEHKSNLPAQRAATLEAQATALEAAARDLESKNNHTAADTLREQALEKRLDAQGQKLEQGRQFTKQMQKQVVPRLEAMGMEVPEKIRESTKIMGEMEMLESSPAQVQEKLKAKKLGTPESVINKGAGLIEFAQKGRPGQGNPAKDVFPGNVEDKLETDKVKREKWQTGKDSGDTNSGGGRVRQKIKDRPPEPRTGKSSFVNQRGLEIDAFDEQVGQNTDVARTLNVVLNVAQFAECMQRGATGEARAKHATECLKEQAVSLALDEAFDTGVGAATSAAGQKLNFYFPKYYARFAPGIGVLGTVVMAAQGAYVSGQQVGDAMIEGKQWWDALDNEQRAQAGSDALERRNTMSFARYLLRREAVAQKLADDILEKRRNLMNDLARLEREQQGLLFGIPRDFEKSLSEYRAQVNEAQRQCEGGGNATLSTLDSSQNRLQDLARDLATDQALQFIRSCKNPEELQQAELAWQRAMKSQQIPVASKSDSLLNEVPLWGNLIKQLKTDHARIKSEKEKLPGRIAALKPLIVELQRGQQAFMDAFPPGLIDMMNRNSGRIQALQTKVDAIGGTKGIDDPLGIQKLDNAYRDLGKDALRIDAAMETIARHTGNFHLLVDTQIYDLTRCRGRQPAKEQKPAPVATQAEKDYLALRNACAARHGIAPATASDNLPRVIKPSPEQIAGWQKSLACLREGKRKTTFWIDCNGNWTNGSRDKAISDLEDLLRRNGVDPTDHNAPPPSPGMAQTSNGHAMSAISASGTVNIHTGSGAVQPFSGREGIPYGSVIETGAGSQLSFVSPGNTTVIVAPGSRIKMHPPGGSGRQVVEILSGGVEIKRPNDAPGRDDIETRTRDANSHADGTQYKVTLTERGTTYQVFEGRIAVNGAMLTKTDASFQVRGKTAFQHEMRLSAGEHGIAFSTVKDERLTASPVSPLERPDPWNDPHIQQLIDEWLRGAKPAVRADLPGPWHFTEWGQALGPGSKAVGAPDHPAGWTRHQSLWAKRMQFDSLNLCTMGDYIERRIGGKELDGCAKAAPGAPVPSALPSWISHGTPAAAGTSTARKPAELIESVRAELVREASRPTPAEAPVQPAPPVVPRQSNVITQPAAPPRFAGDWDCALTHPDGRTAQARFQILRDRNDTYYLQPSGVQAHFAAKYVQGNRIGFIIGDGSTNKDIALDFEVNGNVASGTDRVDFTDGRTISYAMRCKKTGESNMKR